MRYFLVVGLLGAVFTGKWALIILGLGAFIIMSVAEKGNQYASSRIKQASTPIVCLLWLAVALLIFLLTLAAYAGVFVTVVPWIGGQ